MNEQKPDDMGRDEGDAELRENSAEEPERPERTAPPAGREPTEGRDLTQNPEPGEVQEPVIVAVPKDASEPLAVSGSRGPDASRRKQLHVAPNLLDLISEIFATPEEAKQAEEQRNLEKIIHGLLIVGLVISTALMLAGLVLDFALKRDVPTAVPDFRDVFLRVAALRPSGFLALGLLVLIATPILRVASSVIAFIAERNWRFAGITFLVLCIVIFSVVFGKG